MNNSDQLFTRVQQRCILRIKKIFSDVHKNFMKMFMKNFYEV